MIVDTSNAQAGGDLGRHDGNAGRGNKGRDGNIGNKFDDPTQSKQAKEEQDDAAK